MPVYSFRFLPDDREPIDLEFANDGAAIAEANRALSDLLFDAATQKRTTITHVEVRGEDGTLVADVGPRLEGEPGST